MANKRGNGVGVDLSRQNNLRERDDLKAVPFHVIRKGQIFAKNMMEPPVQNSKSADFKRHRAVEDKGGGVGNFSGHPGHP